MRRQAKDWMLKRIKAGAGKGHGVFCIGDFQQYLNKVLLPAWEVPKSTLPYRARFVDPVDPSKYLQVSWSTARSWALAIGANFVKHKKGYYVDGHDRKDVLEHRGVWLGEERELELRQYLWVQLTVEQARKLNVPGYRRAATSTTESSIASASPTVGKVRKTKRRFRGDLKRTLLVPAPQSEEEKQRQQQIKDQVQKELVYEYTTDAGENMVEVHVDLLSQKVRSSMSTKMKIWGVEFDMGGNLSVRFPHGETPIIKVGTDEVIFKVSCLSFICNSP